ncbi:Oxidoreductase sirO, partial [Lachnellula suecica]
MDSSKKPLPIVFGLGNFSLDPSRAKDQLKILEVALKNNIGTLDTSRHYCHGESETFLGNEGIPFKFNIVTKAAGGIVPGGLTKEGIIKGWYESEAALKVNRVRSPPHGLNPSYPDQVDTYLIHVPDDTCPIGDTMEGIQALYLAGKFSKFGLSNFSARQVKECYNYAKSKGFVLPTCYQSIYGLASRKNEKDLFPLLRRLGISIQAYSPLSSGFLVKTPAEIRAGKGTFDRSTILGKILQDMFGGESFLDFLQKYNELAEEIGSSKVGLALRWVVWNSFLRAELGDCVIPGASSGKQLQDLLDEIEK